MGGCLIALALAFAAQEPGFVPLDADTPHQWLDVWADLGRYEALPRGDELRERLRARLKVVAERRLTAGRERSDRALAYRSRILLASVAHADGAPLRTVADPGAVIELLPAESWRAARATEPSPMRTYAAGRALADATPGELDERVRFARDTIEEDLAAASPARFELAERLARELLERVDTPLHAALCARTLRASGRSEEAREILEQALETQDEPEPRRILAEELARVALASGARERALDALGTALACGSTNAAAELVRLSAAAGDESRALAAARPYLDEAPPPPTVARGWAHTLLVARGAFAPN